MKVASDVETIKSNPNAESHAMTIDENNMAHIINLLTDMYSDPIGSIIREYTSNAIDSHNEAGTDEPVRVTPPTDLNPVFTIEDFGLGLSKKEIVETYSVYGLSTKNESNDQIGGFGIGAKSAFAQTSQFTVVGTKDGERTVVVFSRSSEGGSVDIVSETETDEPNGVKVSIPVAHADMRQWYSKMQAFYAFWPEYEIEIIEAEDVLGGIRRHELKNKLGNFFTIDKESINSYYYYRSIYLLINNISYEFGFKESEHLEDDEQELNDIIINVSKALGQKIVLKVPIGTVDLVPSRESLLMSSRTKDYVMGEIQTLLDSIKEEYVKKIEACENYPKAIKFFESNQKELEALRIDDIEYEGKTLKIPHKQYPRIQYDLYDEKCTVGKTTYFGNGVLLNTKGAPSEVDFDPKSQKLMGIKRLVIDATKWGEIGSAVYLDKDVKGRLSFEKHGYTEVDISDIIDAANAYREKRKRELEEQRKASGGVVKSTGVSYVVSNISNTDDETRGERSVSEIVNLFDELGADVICFTKGYLSEEPRYADAAKMTVIFVKLTSHQQEHVFKRRMIDAGIDESKLVDSRYKLRVAAEERIFKSLTAHEKKIMACLQSELRRYADNRWLELDSHKSAKWYKNMEKALSEFRNVEKNRAVILKNMADRYEKEDLEKYIDIDNLEPKVDEETMYLIKKFDEYSYSLPRDWEIEAKVLTGLES